MSDVLMGMCDPQPIADDATLEPAIARVATEAAEAAEAKCPAERGGLRKRIKANAAETNTDLATDDTSTTFLEQV